MLLSSYDFDKRLMNRRGRDENDGEETGNKGTINTVEKASSYVSGTFISRGENISICL